MKLDETNFWHYALMVVPSGAIVAAGFTWLLFNSHFGDGMPEPMKIWAPVVLYIVAIWFLLAKRPRNIGELFKK